MTTCIALEGKNCAVLVADRQITMGSSVHSDNAEKLMQIGNLAIGFTGSYWVKMQIESYWQGIDLESFYSYVPENSGGPRVDTPLDLKNQMLETLLFREEMLSNDDARMALHHFWSLCVDSVEKRHLENGTSSPEEDPYSCQMVVACKQGVFEISPYGDIIKGKFICVGSGKQYALGALFFRGTGDMQEQCLSDLKSLALSYLKVAAQGDPYTGETFNVISIEYDNEE